MNQETQILKVDERGRVVTPREQQEAVVDAFEKSGMTGAQFARHVGVKYPTLMNWVQRRRRARESTPPEVAPVTGAAWIEAVVERPSSEGLVIEMSESVRIKIREQDSVGMAVQLLQGLGYGRPC